ncbi:hypothetical protein JOM56_004991 [Amanita muscaria]
MSLVSQMVERRGPPCVAEGHAGPVIKAHSALAVTDIINAIQPYNDTMSNPTWLVQPTTEAHQESIVFDFADELLDTILRALRTLNESDFSEIASIIPQPNASYPEPDSSFSPFNLPAVLVPPEVIEIDGLSVHSETDIQVRKEQWPEFYVRLKLHLLEDWMVRSNPVLHRVVDIE